LQRFTAKGGNVTLCPPGLCLFFAGKTTEISPIALHPPDLIPNV
jgi:hypothetical protein